MLAPRPPRRRGRVDAHFNQMLMCCAIGSPICRRAGLADWLEPSVLSASAAWPPRHPSLAAMCPNCCHLSCRHRPSTRMPLPAALTESFRCLLGVLAGAAAVVDTKTPTMAASLLNPEAEACNSLRVGGSRCPGASPTRCETRNLLRRAPVQLRRGPAAWHDMREHVHVPVWNIVQRRRPLRRRRSRLRVLGVCARHRLHRLRAARVGATAATAATAATGLSTITGLSTGWRRLLRAQ